MRRIAALALALLLTVFAGCGKKLPDPPAPNYTLEILEEYRKENGCSIKLLYPQISGLPDAGLEQQINFRAKEYADAAYTRCSLGVNGSEYTSLSAQVLLSTRDVFSVLVTGVFQPQGGENTVSFAYTVNCDVTTAEFLETEDIAADYSALKQLFLQGKFTPDFGNERDLSKDELQVLLLQYKDEYGIFPYLYFREGKLGILLETLPELGGYAGFTLEIVQAAQYLHTERAAIASLCPQ